MKINEEEERAVESERVLGPVSPTLLNASNNNLGVVFGVGVVNCDVEVVVLLL